MNFKLSFILCSLMSCFLIEEDDKLDFTQQVDSNNIRIFGKEGVSLGFLNKVAKSYNAMLKENPVIDHSMRLKYLMKSKNEHVYQSVGLHSSYKKNEEYAHNIRIPKPYRNNCTDFIWVPLRSSLPINTIAKRFASHVFPVPGGP